MIEEISSGTLNRLKFGAGTDMVIYHGGTDNFIKTLTVVLKYLQVQTNNL